MSKREYRTNDTSSITVEPGDASKPAMLDLLGLEQSLRHLSDAEFEERTSKANAAMAADGCDALRSLLRVGIHLLELKRRNPRGFHAVADRLAIGIERSMRAKVLKVTKVLLSDPERSNTVWNACSVGEAIKLAYAKPSPAVGDAIQPRRESGLVLILAAVVKADPALATRGAQVLSQIATMLDEVSSDLEPGTAAFNRLRKFVGAEDGKSLRSAAEGLTKRPTSWPGSIGVIGLAEQPSLFA